MLHPVQILRGSLPLLSPAFRSSHFRYQVPPAAEGGTCGWELSGNFCLNVDFHTTFRDLLHAANLQHGNDGFTSPPKEGMLRIFSPLKIRSLRPGLNPRTWVPKASTLPLDHNTKFSCDSLHPFTPCIFSPTWQKKGKKKPVLSLLITGTTRSSLPVTTNCTHYSLPSTLSH